MTPAAWLARVREMDTAELRFRAAGALRTRAARVAARVRPASWSRSALGRALRADCAPVSRARVHLAGGDWMAAHRELAGHFLASRSPFPLSAGCRTALVSSVVRRFPRAADAAADRARRLLAGRFDLLGYRDLRFATSRRDPGAVDWHFDPVHRRAAPRIFHADVRYLDPGSGDHKIIWELNRHQHWLRLGRSAWLNGDPACHRLFVDQLTDWLAENPPLLGINWASSLELSIRCLSWLWSLHFFIREEDTDAAADERPWLVDLLMGLVRQLDHVERNLSTYFSPNTHLTGEALGLYVCGLALPELASARRWTTTGRAILMDEVARQVLPDGLHVERSTHYHRYTLDFYNLALVVARRASDEPAAAAFAGVVSRLAASARLLADDRGRMPRLGDDDGGSLFPICGREPDDVRDSLATASRLVDGDAAETGPTEETLWLLGPAAEDTRLVPTVPRLSGALPAAGYYVSRVHPDVHLVIDGGPHGYLGGGHAHADALSLTVTWGGKAMLIDPGTMTYTMSPELRDRFRSSPMHNTLSIDGRSQSAPGGPFAWRRMASATTHRWLASASGDFFEGTTDAYAPVVHRRRVVVLPDGTIVVLDTLAGEGIHDILLHWHFAPAWEVQPAAGSSLVLTHPSGARGWLVTSAPRLEVFFADDAPGLGWSSPAYGGLLPSVTARAALRRELPAVVATVIAGSARLHPPTVVICAASITAARDVVACRLDAGDGARLIVADSAPADTFPMPIDGVEAGEPIQVVEVLTHRAARAAGQPTPARAATSAGGNVECAE